MSERTSLLPERPNLLAPFPARKRFAARVGDGCPHFFPIPHQPS